MSDQPNDTPEEENGDGEDDEEGEAVAVLVRYGLSAIILLAFGIAFLASLQVIPETIVTPNASINASGPVFENDTEGVSASIVSINTTVVEFNNTTSNVTLRDGSNETTGRLIGVGHPSDQRIKYSDDVNQACLAEKTAATDEYIDSQLQQQFLVIQYVNNTTSFGFQLFRNEDGANLNGQLLQRGYAFPVEPISKSLRNASVRAAENETGVWECIPEDKEESYIPSNE